MTQSRQTYTISELAREFAITPRSIRHYEDQGLLAPARQGQHRVYSAADRVALKLILRGKRLGFSLADSAGLIRMYQPANKKPQLEALLAKIGEKRARLEQQLADIRQLQQELDAAEARCLEALKRSAAR